MRAPRVAEPPAQARRTQRTRHPPRQAELTSRTGPQRESPGQSTAHSPGGRKVDEAHGYKNLRTPSNIPDAAIDGSMRASDLDMKISYLRER